MRPETSIWLFNSGPGTERCGCCEPIRIAEPCSWNQRAGQLNHLFHHATTQQAIRGTAWAGYQAVTEYLDHYAPVRANVTNTKDARATRILTSSDPTLIKQRAFELTAA